MSFDTHTEMELVRMRYTIEIMQTNLWAPNQQMNRWLLNFDIANYSNMSKNEI